MGTDKNDDVLYVGNSWAGTLAKINTRHPGDQHHRRCRRCASPIMWRSERPTTPRLAQHLDDRPGAAIRTPQADAFTAFDIPTRGSEVRLRFRCTRGDGKMQVVLPSYRTRKVTVMAFRSETDIAATKAQSAQ